MYVVGAKNTKEIGKIRTIVPNSFLLVPGIGAQGGNLEEICKYGLDKDLKLIDEIQLFINTEKLKEAGEV